MDNQGIFLREESGSHRSLLSIARVHSDCNPLVEVDFSKKSAGWNSTLLPHGLFLVTVIFKSFHLICIAGGNQQSLLTLFSSCLEAWNHSWVSLG